MKKLSHIDESGAARMVDVSAKARVRRTARAAGRIDLSPATVDLDGVPRPLELEDRFKNIFVSRARDKEDRCSKILFCPPH